MAKIELHDFTFEQDQGIVLHAGQINFVFVDDEANDVYVGSTNSVVAAINSLAMSMQKEGLSANFFVFNEPLVAAKFIAENDSKLTLVISDNNMPDINGFDMIRRLRDQGVETQAIIRSGLPTDVPRGVITVDKLVGPKVLYREHIRPILEEKGHFKSSSDVTVEQGHKPAP